MVFLIQHRAIAIYFSLLAYSLEKLHQCIAIICHEQEKDLLDHKPQKHTANDFFNY
jgi:hypothetical protein